MLTAGRVRTLLIPFTPSLTAELTGQVCAYMALLSKWNSKMNLTSIESEDSIVTRHFGESFFGAQAVPITEGRLADVGSGAGFPGLAIAILRPNLSVSAFESSQRKASFLKEVCRQLGLRNVSVVPERFELPRSGSNRFDFVTIRAVAFVEGLAPSIRGVLSVHGKFVLWLGKKDADRITSLDEWGWGSPVPIPCSKERVILVGWPKRPARIVSRGTS